LPLRSFFLLLLSFAFLEAHNDKAEAESFV
jgi:hypothetical protein